MVDKRYMETMDCSGTLKRKEKMMICTVQKTTCLASLNFAEKTKGFSLNMIWGVIPYQFTLLY